MSEEILNRALPKWPQMLVTGEPVTVDQAKEIIRRTDYFFSSRYAGGNDRAFVAWAQRTVGMPEDIEPGGWEAFAQWRERWGYISTEYVTNGWISNPFIYGPHGWCHPDGQIGYIDNVGKWPSVGDVLEDWKALASAFPFIRIGVTLFNRSDCEEGKSPVVSMRVADGSVELVDPSAIDVHAGHRAAARSPEGNIGMDLAMARIVAGNGREQGVPREWIEEWGRTHRGEP